MSKRESNKKVSALYENLIDLCKKSDCFVYHDEYTSMQTKVRIFNHSMDVTTWNLNRSVECNGITFSINDKGEPLKIICRPMEKIFGMNENTKSDIKPSEIDLIMEKMDGVLVSSFVDGIYPCLKTKDSIYSKEAELANGVLYSEKYAEIRNHIVGNPEYTYNFEFTSPHNKIVIAYKEPALTLLNVRNNETGEYIPYKQLFSDSVLRPHLVKAFNVDVSRVIDILNDVKTSQDIEGIVGLTKSGEMFKIKSDWYINVNHIKEAALLPKNLIYYVTESETDDLKEAFSGETEALKIIEKYEYAFRDILRKAFQITGDFYTLNAGHDFNLYSCNASIEARKHGEANEYIFSCLMLAYNGVDYNRINEYLKSYFVSNYKKFVK